MPPNADLSFPTEGMLKAITPRTRMIFLNTPNNPTGQLIALDDIARIAGAAPQAIVLVDEAYIEFGGATFLRRLASHPNVLVGRTFSKAYGLAGMRVGIVIGQPPALDPVRAVTLPFNINVIAMAAVSAALDDVEFLPRYAAQVHDSRERLYAACAASGWATGRVPPTTCSCAWATRRPSSRRWPRRRSTCAIGRTTRPRPGCIRITAGVIEHTDRAIQALESVVAGRQRR